MKLTEKLKHKYALSDTGAKAMIRAFIAVTASNLVLMLPVGLLYMLSSYLLDGELPREKAGFFTAAVITALVLIAVTAVFQYRATFLSTYIESGVRRRALAEKLRKIPLSFFGKKGSCRSNEHHYDRLRNDRDRLFPLDPRACGCNALYSHSYCQPLLF